MLTFGARLPAPGDFSDDRYKRPGVGFVSPTMAPGRLLAALNDRLYALVLSEYILDELARTFTKRYFVQRLSLGQRAENVAFLRSRASMTPITVSISGVATHPEDDLVLATAVSGKAEYLVTGDLRLRQRVPEYQGVHLVSPREFLALLP